VSLSKEYKRQFKWRDWSRVLRSLPPVEGQTVLDLGCGAGDLAAEFVARGAHVIGIDANKELIREAMSRGLPNASFRFGDLHTVTDFGVVAGGLWCSFAAAYLLDLPDRLSAWAKGLGDGGWIALTEIDDLFGHEPLDADIKALLADFAHDALASERYDFRMGRKLEGYLRQAGFTASNVLALDDQELSFDGPALPGVVEAWQRRFDRMKGLRDFCGSNMERVRDEFLKCLRHPAHTSLAKVICCIATKGA
jgi:SAM-dependent methyltransferase